MKRSVFYKLLIGLFFFVLAFQSFPLFFKAEENEKVVIIIPVQKEVEKGLAEFIDRSLDIAENEAADHIIFDMDTPGGAVDAATEIAKRMRATDIPITVFVNKKAISAGAYLALNADHIVMVPGSTMGAAAIIDAQGNTAGKKAESFWLKEMEGAANLNNRDPVIARAMVDDQVDLPDLGAAKGSLLTLTANQAVGVGYAEAVVKSEEELLSYLNLSQASVKHIEISFAEKLARFITNPIIVPILLSIGSLGLVMELYSPGFGVPGMMGISALVLFFYGHLVAGLAGLESIILLVIGILAIVMEIFVPGGILGILGIAAIIGSLLLSTANLMHMLLSIFIALMVTIIASIVMFKVFGFNRGFLRHIILSDSTSTEKGYVSFHDKSDMVGLEGKTLTPLRPSGTAGFGEERLDVVTEGGFIEQGKQVQIVKVDGGRIVVREQVKNNEL